MDQEESDDPVTEDDLRNASSKLLSTNWQQAGRELGLTDALLDRVKYDNYLEGLEEIIYKMLLTWQQHKGRAATKRKLKMCLEKFDNIKKENSTDVPLEVQTTEERSREILSVLQSTLRNWYKDIQLPSLEFFGNKTLFLKEFYIYPELNRQDSSGMETIESNISIDSIFRTNSSTRILIEGDPGYGKTTFLCKLASDWSENQDYIRSKFSLLFFVPLRHYKGNLNETLSNYVEDIHGFGKAEINQVITCKGKESLLLMDGFDELEDFLKTALMNDLKKCGFRDMTVVITSRTGQVYMKDYGSKNPLFEVGAKSSITSSFSDWDMRIKIEGISEDKKEAFLEKYFNTDITGDNCDNFELLDDKFELFLRWSLNSLYKCPLFLVLFAILVEEEEIKPTDTTTDLYKHIFNFLVKKTNSTQNVSRDLNEVNIFDTTAETVYHHDRLLLLRFGELALKKLQHNHLSFSEEEIFNLCPDGRKIVRFGFLTKNTFLCKRKFEFSFEPVHKTFLEFLASFYISSLRCESEIKENIRFVINEEYFEIGSSLILSFLVNLLGERAHILFNHLSPMAGLFTHLSPMAGLFSPYFAVKLFSEMAETDENKKSFHPFVPIVSNTYQFFSEFSPQKYCSFLQMASENSLVHIYEFGFSTLIECPLDFFVPLIYLKKSIIRQQFCDYLKERRIRCDEIACIELELSKEMWFLIKCIRFKTISFINCYFSEEMIQLLHGDFLTGELKNIKINHFVLGRKWLYRERVLYLLEPYEAGVEVAFLLILDVLLNNQINEIFVGRQFDSLSMKVRQNVLNSALKSSLRSCYFTSGDEFQMNISSLVENKTINYFYIDKNMQINKVSESFQIDTVKVLEFSRERAGVFDCKLLSLFTNLRALSISSVLFSYMRNHLPSEWPGFKTIKEIELIMNDYTEYNVIKFLQQFSSLQILTVTFAYRDIMQKYFANGSFIRNNDELDILAEVLCSLALNTLNLKTSAIMFDDHVNYILKNILNRQPHIGKIHGKEIVAFWCKNLRIYSLDEYTCAYSRRDSSIMKFPTQLLLEKIIENFYYSNHSLDDFKTFFLKDDIYHKHFRFRRNIINKSEYAFLKHVSDF